MKLDILTKHNFKCDSASAVNFAFFNYLITPFLIPLAIRHGATSVQTGFIAAAPFLGLLTAAFWGHWTQNKNTLVWIVLPMVVGRSLLGAVPWLYDNMWLSVAIILAANFLFAIGSPAYTGLMQKIYPSEYRGALMGWIRSVVGLTAFLAVTVGGYLYDHYDSRWMFAFAAGLGVISALTFAFIKIPGKNLSHSGWVLIKKMPGLAMRDVLTKDVNNGSKRGYLRDFGSSQVQLVREDKAFRLMLGGVFLFGFGNILLAPVYPWYQVQILHLTNLQIGWVAAGYSLSWLVAYPLVGRFVDRIHPSYAVLLAGIFYGLAPGINLVGQNFTAAILGSVVLGFADAFLDIGWQTTVIRIAPQKVAAYAGIYLTLLGLRGSIAPFVGNALLPGISVYGVFAVTILLVLAGVALLWVKRRTFIAGA